MAYYVYILRCGDGSLYTGSTNDVARRLAVHRSGKGAKYTRSRLPVELVYQEIAADRSAALRREAAIKRLTRGQKRALIEEENIMQRMRRQDRQQPEAFAWAVTEQCQYAVLAMTAEDGTPYAIPIHIVRRDQDLYFHCALEGRKLACLRHQNRVCVTCVGESEVDQAHYTTRYGSAVAFGSASEVTDRAEKVQVLRLLCLRFAPEAMDRFEDAAAKSVEKTAVWKIAVEEITGKCNPRP